MQVVNDQHFHKESQDELKQRIRILLELENLKEVEKQKETFLAMITHELRTPLTPIIGYCEALECPKIMGQLSEKQSVAVNKIHANALRLRELISDLLDAHKLEMNKMTFNITRFNVCKSLSNLIANIEIITNQKNIEISSSVNDDLFFNTDEERIIQILQNLIFNAIDFVPKDIGKIELNAKQEDNLMIFSVKDNGVGVFEDIKEKLFQKFYQTDTLETREHGGTGLGLSICKGLVSGLGGQIWVKNNVESGSTFYFSVANKGKVSE